MKRNPPLLASTEAMLRHCTSESTMSRPMAGVDDQNHGVDPTAVRAELERIRNLVIEPVNDLGKRLGDVEKRVSENWAVTLDNAQKMARRPAGSASSSTEERRGRLSDAADPLQANLRGATTARVELPISVKAGLSSGSSDGATYVVPTESLGPLSAYHPPVGRLVDLLPSQPVTSNKLQYVRLKYDANSPGGNAADIVAEGAPKPQSGIETVLVEVDVPTIAHWVVVTKQLLDDISELRQILGGILTGGTLDRVDEYIYATLTTSGNYTSFSPTASEEIGDGVARAAAQIANAGGKNIIVALNPADYLTMQLTKADTSGVYLGVPPNLASRVVAVPAVASGKILAFAPGSGASWADREGVSVEIGLNADDWTKNLRTILAECRGAAMVRDPAHVAYGNATA